MPTIVSTVDCKPASPSEFSSSATGLAGIRSPIRQQDEWFGGSGINCAVRIAGYEGSFRKDERLIAFERDGHAILADFVGADWRIGLRTKADQKEGWNDFFLTVAATRDAKETVAFALEFQIAQWSREHFLVIPGGVYDGNRFASRDAGYPPTAAQTGDIGPEVPTVIGDLPRLSDSSDSSRLQQLTADAATPGIGYFDPHARTGVWLLTHQGTRLGVSGLEVEEDLDGGRAVIRISAPGVREGTRYHAFQTDRPSPDHAAVWRENEEAELHVRALVFKCEDKVEFLTKFYQIRKMLTGPTSNGTSFPLSAASALIEEKYHRENWAEAAGIYATDTVSEDRPVSWQSGWIGGGMVTLPFLASGNPQTVVRARSALKFLCTEAQAPSGFFRSFYRDGVWTDDSFGHSKGGHWHMTRKSADVLLFLAKQIAWAGQDADSLWRGSAERCAEAFVKLWRDCGEIGQFVDELTGELIVGGSDSAAILPAALCAAGEVLERPAWVAVAVEVGNGYWLRFSRQGFTTGGPGEILTAPDSESAFGLLESMVALWEVTRQEIWLARAEAVAAYCASWCVSYDFIFPPASTFGAMRMATTGTVIASAQNKHSSPGICTLSGDSLFRLFRATGDCRHLDLLRDIARSLSQYVSREDRPILARHVGRSMPPGWICERVNLSDWLEPVGEIFYGSCWCETSLLLTALEVPAIYAQSDTGLIVSLDHLDARWLASDGGSPQIEITNSSNFPATARVLCESSSEAMIPLLPGAVSRLIPVSLPAGMSLRVSLSVMAAVQV